MKINENKIFEINNNKDFEDIALQIFNYQANNNKIYNQYLKYLNINYNEIVSLKKIPFLPIELFKTHVITTGNEVFKTNNYKQFKSSGTTASAKSKLQKLNISSIANSRSIHYVKDLSLYEKSFCKGFEYFYGNIEDYVILALLPSYLEQNDSSLVYMVDKLIELSNNNESGFYLNNLDELAEKINNLIKTKQKAILIGVSFALLDLVEKHQFVENEIIVMETGGMKGRRKELIRTELHKILKNSLKVEKIHSEYGMTELLSQAYSTGNEVFETPNWLKILIRDTNDPFSYLANGKTGGINVIDLANLHSCAFIETKDLGKIVNNNKFEILGRFDNSDIRGCNLLL